MDSGGRRRLHREGQARLPGLARAAANRERPMSGQPTCQPAEAPERLAARHLLRAEDLAARWQVPVSQVYRLTRRRRPRRPLRRPGRPPSPRGKVPTTMSGEQLALDLAGVGPGPLRAIDTGYVEDLADAIDRGGRGKSPAAAVGTAAKCCKCIGRLVSLGEENCAKCGPPS